MAEVVMVGRICSVRVGVLVLVLGLVWRFWFVISGGCGVARMFFRIVSGLWRMFLRLLVWLMRWLRRLVLVDPEKRFFL
jgi:hypothetical protein